MRFVSPMPNMLSFIRQNSFLKRLLASYNNNYSATGSFILFRKIILDKANFFDPDFFIYCEELNLCNRINSHGYKVLLKVIKKPFMSTKEVKAINLRCRTNLMHPMYLFISNY